MWILALPALAAPVGYRETKKTDSCTLFLGPPNAQGVVPMHAECTWSGLQLDKMDAMFSRWQDHHLFFATIGSSEVVRTEGPVAFVRQVHVTKGLSDRECVLRFEKSSIPGGWRYAWTLDSPQPAVAEGRVPVAFDDGYWEFTGVDGGVKVVHHLEYDPGGSVPGFLVKWFQTSGLEGIVTDLETWARAH